MLTKRTTNTQLRANDYIRMRVRDYDEGNKVSLSPNFFAPYFCDFCWSRVWTFGLPVQLYSLTVKTACKVFDGTSKWRERILIQDVKISVKTSLNNQHA